jgi:hypothetical protein
MTPAERQEVVDLAQLSIHQYFDHYLTDVFPQQIGHIMGSHEGNATAHEVRFAPLVKSARRFNRIMWTVAGGIAVAGFFGTIAIRFGPQLVKAFSCP